MTDHDIILKRCCRRGPASEASAGTGRHRRDHREARRRGTKLDRLLLVTAYLRANLPAAQLIRKLFLARYLSRVDDRRACPDHSRTKSSTCWRSASPPS